MRRRASPRTRGPTARPPLSGESRTGDGSSDGYLQKRLEEALEREAATRPGTVSSGSD
jgi:hypothetical protein